jgi:hypothetical protein
MYYCSQNVAEAECAVSADGGLTYGAGVPMWNSGQCFGLHGHIKVGPDGTAYVPNKACGAPECLIVTSSSGPNCHPGYAVSTKRRPELGGAHHRRRSQRYFDTGDPAVGIGAQGTMYFGYGDRDGHAKLAACTSQGSSCGASVDSAVRTTSSTPRCQPWSQRPAQPARLQRPRHRPRGPRQRRLHRRLPARPRPPRQARPLPRRRHPPLRPRPGDRGTRDGPPELRVDGSTRSTTRRPCPAPALLQGRAARRPPPPRTRQAPGCRLRLCHRRRLPSAPRTHGASRGGGSRRVGGAEAERRGGNHGRLTRARTDRPRTGRASSAGSGAPHTGTGSSPVG